MGNNNTKEKKPTTKKTLNQETVQEPLNNHSWTTIIDQVKDKSICLEVGCKEGRLGEILHNKKKCKVDGIEEDKKLIQIAQKKNCYQAIYNFKIADPKKSDYQAFFENPIKYDYIIFSTAFNCIEDPKTILVEFFKKLKKSGKIIINFSNVSHIDTCKKTINRTLHDQDFKLENKKTVHIFTKQSFFDLIQEINATHNLSFNINIIGKIIKEPTEYLEKYPNLYKLLNKDKEANVIEYIYEIGKKLKIEEEKEEKQRDYFELLEKELQDRVLFSQQLKLQRQENVNLLNQIRIEGEVNQKLTKENEALKKELEMMLGSKSWKLTKPFRKIIECIRNWRHL